MTIMFGLLKRWDTGCAGLTPPYKEAQSGLPPKKNNENNAGLVEKMGDGVFEWG